MRLEIKAIPPSINKVLRMHRWAKKDLKDFWLLQIRSQMNYVPKWVPTKKRVTVNLHHSRMFDMDNAYGACKVIFDALKHWNLIADDTDIFLDMAVLQTKVPHKQRKTVIELAQFENEKEKLPCVK